MHRACIRPPREPSFQAAQILNLSISSLSPLASLKRKPSFVSSKRK